MRLPRALRANSANLPIATLQIPRGYLHAAGLAIFLLREAQRALSFVTSGAKIGEYGEVRQNIILVRSRGGRRRVCRRVVLRSQFRGS